jgi:hypothetical protein
MVLNIYLIINDYVLRDELKPVNESQKKFGETMLLYLIGNQLGAFLKNSGEQKNDFGSALLPDWTALVKQWILKK